MSESTEGASAPESTESSEIVTEEVSTPEVSEELAASEEVSTEESEDSSEIEEIIEGAADAGEEITVEEAKAIRKIMLKVDGEEIEEELPFDLPPEAEEYMRKQLQMAKVSQKRMQEKSEMERNIEQLASRLDADPIDFLKERGFNVDELMEGHLEKLVQEMEMSPEEKAQREMELELADLREQMKAEKESKDQIEMQAAQQAAESELTNEIESALEAHTNLPKDANTVRKMADLMLVADDHDITLSPKQAAQMLEKEALRDALNLLNSMEGDGLEKFLGEENNKKLRSLRSKRAKSTKTINEVKTTGSEPKKKEARTRTKARDFFNNLGK